MESSKIQLIYNNWWQCCQISIDIDSDDNIIKKKAHASFSELFLDSHLELAYT